MEDDEQSPSRSSYPHKYTGHPISIDPNAAKDEAEIQTITEMRDRYTHLRNVIDGTSTPRFRNHPNEEVFGQIYPEFEDFYSHGQLQHLERVFLMSDQDQDGHLNMFELKYWMEKHGSPISQEEAKQIFRVSDENGDGLLSFREFLLFCKNIELKNIPSTSNQNHLRSAFNLNNDATTIKEAIPHYKINCVTGTKEPFQTIKEDPFIVETGVQKLAGKLKPHATVKGNSIQESIKFFENEIAKENREAELNRLVYEQLGKHRKKKSVTKDQPQRLSQKDQAEPVNKDAFNLQVPEKTYRRSLPSWNKRTEDTQEKVKHDSLMPRPQQIFRTSIEIPQKRNESIENEELEEQPAVFENEPKEVHKTEVVYHVNDVNDPEAKEKKLSLINGESSNDELDTSSNNSNSSSNNSNSSNQDGDIQVSSEEYGSNMVESLVNKQPPILNNTNSNSAKLQFKDHSTQTSKPMLPVTRSIQVSPQSLLPKNDIKSPPNTFPHKHLEKETTNKSDKNLPAIQVNNNSPPPPPPLPLNPVPRFANTPALISQQPEIKPFKVASEQMQFSTPVQSIARESMSQMDGSDTSNNECIQQIMTEISEMPFTHQNHTTTTFTYVSKPNPQENEIIERNVDRILQIPNHELSLEKERPISPVSAQSNFTNLSQNCLTSLTADCLNRSEFNNDERSSYNRVRGFTRASSSNDPKFTQLLHNWERHSTRNLWEAQTSNTSFMKLHSKSTSCVISTTLSEQQVETVGVGAITTSETKIDHNASLRSVSVIDLVKSYENWNLKNNS